jgi:hypothetical protein
LFFWHRDLFFWTMSPLFACISCTSLWYWAKAPSSLDCVGRSAPWPCPAPSPRPQRGAPCHRTLEAYQTFVGISQCRPAEGNTVNKYSLQRNALLLRVLARYLDPMLRAAHRLHVMSNDGRVNKVFSQHLQTATARRRCLCHRCRADRRDILYFGITTSVLAPGCASTCVSTVALGATAAPSSGAIPSDTPVTGTESSASTVVISMATTSGIMDSHKEYKKSISTTTTTILGAYQLCSTHTFHQGSFLQRGLHRDFGVRWRCGFPHLRRTIISTCWSTGLIAVPR